MTSTPDSEIIEIPLPDAKAIVRVDRFARTRERLPGWRTTAAIHRGNHVAHAQSLTRQDRCRSVCDAVDGLVNRAVDAADRPHCPDRRWLRQVISILTAWIDSFQKQAQKESTAMVVAKSAKILNAKECRALLEDFRRSYDCFQNSFLDLGEKAIAIHDQEAYGEGCASFDD